MIIMIRKEDAASRGRRSSWTASAGEDQYSYSHRFVAPTPRRYNSAQPTTCGANDGLPANGKHSEIAEKQHLLKGILALEEMAFAEDDSGGSSTELPPRSKKQDPPGIHATPKRQSKQYTSERIVVHKKKISSQSRPRNGMTTQADHHSSFEKEEKTQWLPRPKRTNNDRKRRELLNPSLLKYL